MEPVTTTEVSADPAPLSGLPARLRALRERAGLSQSILAYRTGLHKSVISFLENGKRKATLQQLDKLSDALHLSEAEREGLVELWAKERST